MHPLLHEGVIMRNEYINFFGWPEIWFDEYGYTNADETTARYFVNKYFDLPEDWDENTLPLTMILVKCRICENVEQVYIRENDVNLIYGWNLDRDYDRTSINFAYNGDYTFTSLNTEMRCNRCYKAWYHNISLTQIWNSYHITTNIEFDSPLEEMFFAVWQAVSNVSLTPQYQIGGFRVDFVHFPSRLAIELDGEAYHSSQQQVNDDRRRQDKIMQLGWRFLRFTGAEVYNEMDKCIAQVQQEIIKISKI